MPVQRVTMKATSSSSMIGPVRLALLLPLFLLAPDLGLQLALLIAQLGRALEVLVPDRVFLLRR